MPDRITVLEYAPGGNHEHGEGPHRGGVQGLLKREQSNGAQHGLSEPPPHPKPPPTPTPIEATSRAKMVGIALLRPPKGSP